MGERTRPGPRSSSRSARRRSRPRPASSTTAPLLKLCRELAETHHAGHEVVLVCSGAIAAGPPALGLPSRPTDIGTLQAVAAVGQPQLMERIGAILVRARARRRPGAAHAARLRPALAVPPRARDAAPAPRPRRGPDRERERHGRRRRDPLRRQRPPRRARLAPGRRRRARAAHRHPRPVHRRSSPRQRSVADRGDRRGRRRPRGGRRRRRARARGSGGMASKLAAAKIAAWSGVRAVIAAADSPSRGARRRRGEAGRHGRSPARGAAPEPQAVDRVRPRRGRAGRRRRRRPSGAVRATVARCSRPVCAASRAGSRPTTRSRSSARTGDRSPRAWSAYSGGRAARGRGAPDVGASPRACRTRSSTATTSSSSPDSGRHEGRFPQGALARARAVRHTTDPATTPLLSHDPRRRPTGGEPPFGGPRRPARSGGRQ